MFILAPIIGSKPNFEKNASVNTKRNPGLGSIRCMP